jgi:hypothetical protein
MAKINEWNHLLWPLEAILKIIVPDKMLDALKLFVIKGFSPSPLERGWGEVNQCW